MTLLGSAGLARLARINHAHAVKLADMLASVKGIEVLNQSFFNEFTVKLGKPAAPVVEALAAKKILAGVPVSRLLPGAGLDDLLILASTEVNTDEDRATLVSALKEVL
jgi:glycine dehydrogenase subunit 1